MTKEEGMPETRTTEPLPGCADCQFRELTVCRRYGVFVDPCPAPVLLPLSEDGLAYYRHARNQDRRTARMGRRRRMVTFSAAADCALDRRATAP